MATQDSTGALRERDTNAGSDSASQAKDKPAPKQEVVAVPGGGDGGGGGGDGERGCDGDTDGIGDGLGFWYGGVGAAEAPAAAPEEATVPADNVWQLPGRVPSKKQLEAVVASVGRLDKSFSVDAEVFGSSITDLLHFLQRRLPPSISRSEYDVYRKALGPFMHDMDDGAVFGCFSSAMAALAGQPSNTEAAISVLVLGEEVHTALDQSCFVTPAHMDRLLPHLVSVSRGFSQSRSDELPELERCKAAVSDAKSKLAQPFFDRGLVRGDARNHYSTRFDVSELLEAARRRAELAETLLRSRMSLDDEIAKGKMRDLVATTFAKLGVELPRIQRFAINQELNVVVIQTPRHDTTDWDDAPIHLLHSALGYEGHEVFQGGAETVRTRSFRALQQLLACGVSPDATLGATLRNLPDLGDLSDPALLECHALESYGVLWEPECARLLLRAGASVTPSLANRMALWSDGQKTQTCAMAERALEPWSTANHELFPDAARRFAVQLLLIGSRLSARPDHAPLAAPWLDIIMPALIDRDTL